MGSPKSRATPRGETETQGGKGGEFEAIARLRRALDMFVVEGIYTSIPLHQRILATQDFVDGKLDTNFLSRMNGMKPA